MSTDYTKQLRQAMEAAPVRVLTAICDDLDQLAEHFFAGLLEDGFLNGERGRGG